MNSEKEKLVFVAKKNTWFKENTKVDLIKELYTDSFGIKVGLFFGIRNLDNKVDEEVCSYDEFLRL